MNSLYQQLNRPNQSVKQMMDMVRSAKNPGAVMQMLVNNNPQMAQVMQVVQQNGGDPKTAFYNLAKQRGVDPEQILSMLR